MPEKYFTPLSGLSCHGLSLSSVTLAGAPRLGWKATVQAPSTVPAGISVICGRVREAAEAGLRKTTKTASMGSSFRDTVVRPFATR